MLNRNPLHTYESLLLGKTLSTAEAVALKRGFTIRVLKKDGKAIITTCDICSDRMNVAIENGIVTKLISWG